MKDISAREYFADKDMPPEEKEVIIAAGEAGRKFLQQLEAEKGEAWVSCVVQAFSAKAELDALPQGEEKNQVMNKAAFEMAELVGSFGLSDRAREIIEDLHKLTQVADAAMDAAKQADKDSM